MAQRVLLVEDDELTSELVCGVLAAKGYDVETAADGLVAVEKLCAGGFDLALIDYHLPEVDGYASARMTGSMLPAIRRPKLVALTADVRSLSARQDAKVVFDAVLPKPFHPAALCALIESLLADPAQEATARASRELWRSRGLDALPRAIAASAASPEQARALRNCFDLVDDPWSADCILFVDAERTDDLLALRRRRCAHLLPVVDLTGARSRELDASFRPDDPGTWSAVAAAILGFRERVAKLTPWVRFSPDTATRLMAQLYVAGRGLEPIPDPTDRRFFSYSGAVGSAAVAPLAEELASRGLLQKSFAERFHACGGCGSHRLNVREECAACRSSDLHAVKMLRHFRCSAVAPEDEFRDGAWFSCPSCAQPLGRYGEDYKRVGAAQRCHGCGEASANLVIGFVCLDCDRHVDAAEVATQDVHAYGLTARGVRFATSPEALPRPAPPAVAARARRLAQEGRRSLVAELRFPRAEGLIATAGFEAFETLRRVFVENLELLLGEDSDVVECRDACFLVMADVEAAEFAAAQDAIVQRCQAALSQPIDAQIAIVAAA